MIALLRLNLFLLVILLVILNMPQESGAAAASWEMVAAASACPHPYTVRAGDSLFSIAQKCGVPVKTLQNWNRLRTTRVVVGQRLLVRPWQIPLAPPSARSAPNGRPIPVPTPRIAPPIQP